MVGNVRALGFCVLFVTALFTGRLSATPPTISSFPYTPNESAQASDFVADFGTGPTTGGSAWSNGTISSPRQGDGGTSVQAWADQPTANYSNNTVTWLHSPIFDFSSDSGLVLEFFLWIKAQNKRDGMKLQVSTNGGSTWSDVTTCSVGYNGDTNTSALLSTSFGGSDNAWSGTSLGGGSANLCTLNLNTWAGQSDVRFRWCFVSNSSINDKGPVLDTFQIVPITATVAYSGGYVAVPQGGSVSATITKSGGSAFTSGMTVSFAGSGLTGTVSSVTSADVCTVAFAAGRTADVGGQTFYVNSGSTHFCRGVVTVFFPQQLIPSRQSGSVLEPPGSAAMGANSVYLHNGEFRHDLPLVSIPGRMLPLSVGLTYRSQSDTIGPLGAGWTASFDKRLYYWSGSDTIDLFSGDGRIDTFSLQAGGTAHVGPYVKTGFFLTITRDDFGTSSNKTDDVFTIHYAHGSTATYGWTNLDVGNENIYREATFADCFGNTNTNTYNSEGQLIYMDGDLFSTGPRYELVFAYNAHGRLDVIADYADYTGQSSVVGSSYTGVRIWAFVYNSDAQLTEIQLPQTERYYSNTKGSTYRTRVQFTYDGSDNMLEVIDARQANETTPLGWLKNHYDGSDRVDYQDIGRTGSSDTTHRQNIVWGTTDGSGRRTANVINAKNYRSEYRVQVTSGSNPLGTMDYVRHYTGEWNTSLSQTANAIRDGSDPVAADPTYFETTFEYDTEFHAIKVTPPRGNHTKFRYDITNSDQRSRGNLLRVLSHPGAISTSGLPSDQVYGLLAKFTYTSAAQFNLLATSINPRGYVLGSSYDIVAHTGLATDNSTAFTTTYTYTFGAGAIPDGTLASVTSPTVNTTDSPDTLNNSQYLTTTFTYNMPYGQLLSSEDQAGVKTSYVYGTSGFEKGYLTQVKSGDQTGTPLITQFAYNSVGRVISVEDPRTNTSVSYVNQLDQNMKSETPQISAASNVKYYSLSEFDLDGNIETFKVSNIDETGTTGTPSTINTTYAYNILDLATSVTEPIDVSTTRTTSFVYDAIYRLAETTLPEGNKSATDYDEINRAIKSYFGYDTTNISKSSALIQSFVYYDANSNVYRSYDGRGNFSQYTYNCYDRCTKAEDRIATTPNYTTFEHDRAGNVTLSIRYGKLRTWTFSGDTYAFASGLPEMGRAESRYDNIGRAYFSRVKAKDHDLSNNLGYSTTYETPPSGASDGWSTSRVQFATNGLVEHTEDDLRYPTKYTYDSYNRLSRVTDDRDGSGSKDNFDEYGYDANGNTTSVRAVLYDDRNDSSPAKDVTTLFYFDEINRLTSDLITISAGTLIRNFSYDSRSQLIDSTDRKGQVRHHEYDFLGRSTRQRAYVSMREIDAGTGYVSTVTNTIASRAVYDKNSNVLQSIDPTGNRTYFHHDMAGRWVQTQHADGGSGTPLKSSAGTTHSVSNYSSTNFWSATSAYDGNSNLLNLKDENDTVRTWTYDNNDQVLTEAGAPAGGNPFGIEGETGLSYIYDGLYRSIYGETHDGTGTLTDTESVYDTLGGLERQRQRVMRAHPGAPGMTESGSVVSEFDESGRRFGRLNPGDVSWTRWAFDRKHRPTDAYLVYGGTWTGAFKISEYKYLGGGLLHSEHIKHMLQTTGTYGTLDVPIISDFERDDLLRLTSVRHWRDDSIISSGQRLLGRYDYAYDENSMMKYEARWHEQDISHGIFGASNTPDETDFYFYSSDNQLEHAVYNATKDTGGTINLASLNWADYADDDNEVTCTDRVTYGRRVSGTRQRVNWYRGSPSRTSAIPAASDDGSSGPTQKTHYDTSDDPSADVDTPAADGDGSRHNYTVIGQTNITYDKNRNVLADGTREFRYSYNNQLRRVWRKSDGDTAGEGLLAKYREDAFGRRVYAESYWELARRDVLDTRFSVDINVDEDADSTDIEYVNGGITSLGTPAPGQLDQRAAWDSRIARDILNTNEAHYFDFDVTVPSVGGASQYLGFIAYDYFELRIFNNKYELWDTSGPTLVGACTVSTSGRHNIGLRAGGGWGVWVDGSQLTLTGGSGSMGLIDQPKAKFGTHINSVDTALTLWENLCYLKSYNRGVEKDSIPADGIVVDVSYFDGPRVVVVREVFVSAVIVVEISKGDGTHCDVMDDGVFQDTIVEPNGRQHTAEVIQLGADQATYDESGTRSTLGSGDAMPGVVMKVQLDAVGTAVCYGRSDPTALVETPCYGPATTSFKWNANNDFHFLAIVLGPTKPRHVNDYYVKPTPTLTTVMCTEGATDVEARGDGDLEGAATNCLCQGSDPSESNTSDGTPDSSTGQMVDSINGNGVDPMQDENGRYFPELWTSVEDASWILHDDGAAFADGKASSSMDDVIPDIRHELNYWRAALFTTSVHNADYRGILDRIKELEDLLEYAENGGGRHYVNGRKVERDLSDEEIARLAAEGREFHLNEDRWAMILFATPQFIVCLGANAAAINAGQAAINNADDVANAIGQLKGGSSGGSSSGTSGGTSGGRGGGRTSRTPGRETGVSEPPTSNGGKKTCETAKNECFTAGTLVWVLKEGVNEVEAENGLARGDSIEKWCELKPIEQIQVGTRVLTRREGDPNASPCFEPVQHLTTNTTDWVVELTTIDPETRTSGVIFCTLGHGFWVTDSQGLLIPLADAGRDESAGRLIYRQNERGETVFSDQGWVFASDLERGFRLASANRIPAQVAGVRTVFRPATKTYNFGVARAHTYFVSAGQASTSSPCLWAHNQTCPKLVNQGGKAPEFGGGKISEARALDAAETYLGNGYREVSPGRYVSKDGLRQVRYGVHETSSGTHHIHFEAYDQAGGRVVENTSVEIVP